MDFTYQWCGESFCVQSGFSLSFPVFSVDLPSVSDIICLHIRYTLEILVKFNKITSCTGLGFEKIRFDPKNIPLGICQPFFQK